LQAFGGCDVAQSESRNRTTKSGLPCAIATWGGQAIGGDAAYFHSGVRSVESESVEVDDGSQPTAEIS
jgi:hypothetical protein